jgi:uncharacterized protein (DUF2252 family)
MIHGPSSLISMPRHSLVQHNAGLRKRRGRTVRRQISRSAHADWESGKRSHDPIDVVLASTYGRVQELIPIKMARMAVSPFGFFRGSVPLMAADLAIYANTGILVQICGDAHVRNLGAFAGPDGRLIFDINDFDETIRGPWEWDVKRLATSLVLAGREAHNSESICRDAVRDFVRTYRQLLLAFSQMPAVDVARYRVHRPFKGPAGSSVLRKAERCTPEHSLERLTTTRGAGTRAFQQNEPLLSRPSKSAIREVLKALGPYRQTLPPERRTVFDCYTPVDVAFKVVGTGSVGTRSYVILFFGNGPSDPMFLQVKEEPASAYSPYLKSGEEDMHQGRRVVLGQRRMQTHSDILLGWTSFGGRDYLVRQLADHKASIENEDLQGKGLTHYACLCGEVLAKGHARSGDACVLAGYLGTGRSIDKALEKFAVKYADQTTQDYERFRAAIRRGRIKAAKNPYL